MLDEGISLKDNLNGPMDAATKLKDNSREGHIDPQRGRKRFRNKEEDVSCVCGNTREDRIHVVGEWAFHKEERERHFHQRTGKD